MRTDLHLSHNFNSDQSRAYTHEPSTSLQSANNRQIPRRSSFLKSDRRRPSAKRAVYVDGRCGGS